MGSTTRDRSMPGRSCFSKTHIRLLCSSDTVSTCDASPSCRQRDRGQAAARAGRGAWRGGRAGWRGDSDWRGRDGRYGGQAYPLAGPLHPAGLSQPHLSPAFSSRPEGQLLAQASSRLPLFLASLADLGPPRGWRTSTVAADTCLWTLHDLCRGSRCHVLEETSSHPQPILSSWGDTGASGLHPLQKGVFTCPGSHG